MVSFTENMTHAQTVCTRPFLLRCKGPGHKAKPPIRTCAKILVLDTKLSRITVYYSYGPFTLGAGIRPVPKSPLLLRPTSS